MRFRVMHLLVLMVGVAIIASALAYPSDLSVGLMALGSWIAFAVLACKAATRPKERAVLTSALIVGVSFLWLSRWESNLPTQWLWEKVHREVGEPQIDSVPNEDDPFGGDEEYTALQNRKAIGNYALSILFGWTGGMLTAYSLNSREKR